MKIKRKMEEKDRELQVWLPKIGIPKKSQKDIKSKIMEKIEEKLEEKLDVDLDHILSLLPGDLEKKIKRRMPLTKLKKVRALENMEEQVLKEICGRLTPMKYANNKVIIPENEPLKMMLFIVEGKVDIKTKDGSSVMQKGARQLCGENLLAWPLSTTFFPHTFPISTQSATATGDVEALILRESDMKTVASKYRAHFIKNYWKLKHIFGNHVSSRPVSLHIFGNPVSRLKRRLNDDFETPTLDLGAALKMFTPQELRKATKNYHASMKIGEGGYGIVYKGILPTKEVVAIKKSESDAPEQTERSVNEAVFLSKVMRHTNVVQLLGCCLETKMPIMVYEFIKGGTLYDHIQMENNRPHLSLESRLKIAVGVASALDYLHHTKSIIHCDVSTKNIFLDENYTVKLSDFGSSKLVLKDEDEAEVEVEYEDKVVSNYSLPRTAEYLDPEYRHTKILTGKSDVYSFGVVLAELLTGRKALFKIPEAEGKQQLLATFFVCSVEEGGLNEIVDGDIVKKEKGSVNEKVEKVSGVVMRCLKPRGEERPSMAQVVSELESIGSPKYTGFAFDSPGYESFFASQQGVYSPQKAWDVPRRATMKRTPKKKEKTHEVSYSG